jgi:predicted amidohydrolase YtcJ
MAVRGGKIIAVGQEKEIKSNFVAKETLDGRTDGFRMVTPVGISHINYSFS